MRKAVCRGLRARPVICAFVLLGAVAVVGCGSDDSSSKSGSDSGSGKAAKIAYLAYTVADYQQAMVDGMKKKIAPDGTVTTFTANFDPAKQTQQCTDALQSGRYNAIVIAPVTPETAVPCVTAAKAKGVPVLALEFPVGKDINAIQPELDGVVKQVPTPPNELADKVVELTKQACGDKDPCEVVGEVATANDPITNLTFDQMEKDPQIKVVSRIPTQYDPAVFAKGLADVLAKNKNIDVVAAAADFGATAAIAPIKTAGQLNKIKILGNGASRSGVAAVKDGSIYGTIGTWPYSMGEVTGAAAVKAVNGQSTDPKGVDGLSLDTPLVITPKNVDQVTPQWGAK